MNTFECWIPNTGNLRARVGTNVFADYSVSSDRRKITVSRDSSGNVTLYDSLTELSYSRSYSNTSSRALLIGGKSGDSMSNAYFYRVTISTNNSLVADLVPAKRKSDNSVGFYDTVRNSFITSSGNSSFIAGPIASITQYTINTSVSPSGSGNVSGGGTYDSGTVVTLTATANTGYRFDSWSDGVINNPRSITVTSDQSLTANFIQQSDPVEQFTISTSVSPSGSGNVSGGGTYDSGTVVTLTAIPNNGYLFDRWSDNVTAAQRTVTVNSNMNLIAYFTEYIEPTVQYTVTASPSPNNGGTITGTGTYDSGTMVTLTAVPSAGYQFGSWSDGVTVNPRTFELTSNISLTAYFTENYDSSILLGVNVYLFNSQTSHYVEQYSMDLDSGGYNYTITAEDIAADVNSIVMLQVVLNNDYYGYLLLNGTIKRNTTTVLTLNNYRVYVNGNTANIYLQSESYLSQGTLNASITVNTANLSIKSNLTTIMIDGNSESQEANTEFDSNNQDLQDQINSYNQLESDYSNQMNEALNEIDFTDPFSQNQNFISSAGFVKSVFNSFMQIDILRVLLVILCIILIAKRFI